MIKKILYVGIELNQRLVTAQKPSTARKSALEYLERVQQNRERFIEQCANQLEADVTREQVGALDRIFRSYDLRMTVSGDKEDEDDEDTLNAKKTKP